MGQYDNAVAEYGEAVRTDPTQQANALERKSHVMAWAADEGLALFSGLNATPKKSVLSEYSSRPARSLPGGTV
jgi:hypothetical protein